MSFDTQNEMMLLAHYALLAEVYGDRGQPQAGLKLIPDALTVMQRTQERFYEAEIHRLNGELLEQQDTDAAEVARAQQVKSWESRATISLGRLWQRQGKTTAARRILC